MNLTPLTPLKILRYFHRKQEVSADKLLIFKKNLLSFLSNLKQPAREGKQETDLRDFLNQSFYKDQYYINKKETADWVIYNGKDASAKVGVIIEVKSTNNAAEMVSLEKPNAKALHELVFYYLRERIDNNNHEIKHLIASNGYEWFVFDEANFDSVVFKPSLVKDYKEWKLSGHDTSHFYKHTAKYYLQKLEKPLECCKIDLRDYEKANDKKLTELYKLLSPEHLLKKAVGNDANKLNTPFYNELLYLIGIEETKASDGNKKVIEQVAESRRQSGSLLENTLTILDRKGCLERMNNLAEYGDTLQEQRYSIALELCITWLNRILFLKLLEGQLVNFHHQDPQFRFLSYEKITDFDEVAELFFEVLAIPTNERTQAVNDKFGVIPYLNSSLFELSELEQDTLSIEDLKDRLEIPYFAQTVLKDDKGKPLKGQAKTLKYLFDFLGAYSFSSTPDQSEHKTLINASVLGLIFEKLNGYKEGSFFTPAFITMFMCRESIRRAVVQKFNEQYAWQCEGFDDLKEQIEHTNKAKRNEYNGLLNSVRICDPAVGSGHFLVSALNEIVTIKAELKLLQHPNGTRLNNVSISIENDELVVFDEDTGEDFDYRLSKANTPISEKQLIQETLFEEKRIIIENCLFGVDINPKSVKICQLRLWIELLKNAYYLPTASGLELQTLPNIDINIKCGNSLVGKFSIDTDLSKILRGVKYSIKQYRDFVKSYKNASNKTDKKGLEKVIKQIKESLRSEIAKYTNPQTIQYIKLTEELYERFDGNYLFGTVLTTKQKEERAKLIDKIEVIKIELSELQKSKMYQNSLEWRFEYPEAIGDEGNFVGFDIVMGNPPYIKSGEFGHLKSYLQGRYEVYNSNGDLFSYFHEKAFQLLKPNGIFCFITNTYDKTTAGKTLRAFMSAHFSFKKYIDFTSVTVFEEATTYPVVLLANKSNLGGMFGYLKVTPQKYNDKQIYYQETEYVSIDQNSLTDVWSFLGGDAEPILAKVTKHTPITQLYSKTYYGIKTGLNKAFIPPSPDLLDDDTDDVARWVYEGEDIKKWISPTASKKMIVFPNKYTQRRFKEILEDNEDEDQIAFQLMIGDFPKTMTYLSAFEEKAKARYDKGMFWWELRNCAYYPLFLKPKIIFPNLQNTNKFSLDTSGSIINAPAVFIPTADKALLAILNSKLVWFFLKSICVVRNGGFIEVKPQYVEQLTIPEIPDEIRVELVNLVEKILFQKDGNPSANVSQLEAEIDNIVFGLYGLSQEEQEIVLKG